MLRKGLFIVTILLTIIVFDSSAQQKYHIVRSHLIGIADEDPFNPAPLEMDIYGYPANDKVLKIWNRLLSSLTTSDNKNLLNSINVKSADLQGIHSINVSGQNIIFYNENFFSQFEEVDKVDVDYLILFSLAHEISHFINGDVKYLITTPNSESIADLYACNALCRMNSASKENIYTVIMALDGAMYSDKYFSKGKRIRMINSFFDKGLCVSSTLFDNFSKSGNPHNFFVCNYKEYTATIDLTSNQYVLTLDMEYSGWRWTYIPFAEAYTKTLGANKNVRLSFDFTSNNNLQEEFIGFISFPSCITKSCPGGSHYDLWFVKTKDQSGTNKVQSLFFYNDNCKCNIGNTASNTNSKQVVSSVSHISIVKHGEDYDVLIDGNQSINFKFSGNILSTLLYSFGTHYLSNFKMEILN